ncbi:ATP-binding protein [Enterococcus sp. BWM-S5]|uniref:ATP-binding protein n=1 Tax=Enterococcus larvae TaxID=2794352 RepID=A0ABS4CF78_9ENTE|nr:ATP-binding protein [Enterococcus larvae]MBP1044873.1 ATP-binding protein [Enterococcus larvae]
MNITKGRVAKAQKVVVYGPEGIGKSTFAAQFPDPLFIDTEGSTSNMDVARFDKPTSWTMLLQQVDYVKMNRPCQTLVIDTADWAEELCKNYLMSANGWQAIDATGYGVRYVALATEWGRLLNKLSDLVEAGINVVLTAHAQIRKFDQPDELGSYDRWELKLEKKNAPLAKEWADMVLFCNYKTIVIADGQDGKKKAQGGKRVIYTTHHPAWDAKNRFELPDQLDMDFNLIAGIFQIKQPPLTPEPTPTPEVSQPLDASQVADGSQQPVSEPVADIEPPKENLAREEPDFSGIPTGLSDLMKLHNVLPIEIQQAVGSKGYYTTDTPISNYDPSFIDGVLVGAWNDVYKMIEDIRSTQKF